MGKTVYTAAVIAALAALVLTAPDAQAQGHQQRPTPAIDFEHPAYKDIQREADQGRAHTDQAVNYGTPFPTSGPHASSPTPAGFYDDPVAREPLVHALEHGNIVIYYDEPGDAAMKVIRGWTDRFNGVWDGVIAVPHEGLGERVVLTAWQHRLELDKLDPRASLFVDAFRGRGPERRVR